MLLKKKAKRNKKRLIGWLEHVDFSNWGIEGVKAKIDTGATTSSLDVDHIEIMPGGKVSFNLVVTKKPRIKKISLIEKLSRVAKVKASPIHNVERVFVKTQIKMGKLVKEIEVNLIDRSNMTYRMLLGRSALKGSFLVDVGRKYMLTTNRKSAKAVKGKKK